MHLSFNTNQALQCILNDHLCECLFQVLSIDLLAVLDRNSRFWVCFGRDLIARGSVFVTLPCLLSHETLETIQFDSVSMRVSISS